MPKKKRRDTQEKESRRFVETARKLEADESGKAFEDALSSIVRGGTIASSPKKNRSRNPSR